MRIVRLGLKAVWSALSSNQKNGNTPSRKEDRSVAPGSRPKRKLEAQIIAVISLPLALVGSNWVSSRIQ